MKNKIAEKLHFSIFLLLGLSCLTAQIPGMPVGTLKERMVRNVFGGTADDKSYSVTHTADGGYAVAGSTESNNGDVSGNHGNNDVWIVKFKKTGDVEWKKTYGGSGKDEARAIIQTADGGYAVAGYTTSSNSGNISSNHGGLDVWVVKLDPAGAIEWQKTYGGSGTDEAKSIIQNTDGSYVLAGYTQSNDGDVSGNHGNTDFWVVKLSGSGNIEWQKAQGGTNEDVARSVISTPDGGYVVAGYTYSNDGNVSGNHGNYDLWVVKFSGTGALEWQKPLGGTDDDGATSIAVASDGGYVVAGYTYSTDGDVTGNHGNYDIWVVKLSGTGVIEWKKTLGGSIDEYPNAVIRTSDGGYAMAGYTASSNSGDVSLNHGNYDVWLVKLDETGGLQWEKLIGGASQDIACSVSETIEGKYVVSGYTDSVDGDIIGTNSGASDFFILQVGADGHVVHFYDDTAQ
ncbi:T9SS C-terminal target domain-containing protein [uncultured Chryseobacterium sp.]|uniref:T9SS C-terminal target domain-containing protein n=1 Tax=uncultured Chryseobacterium sp. TaxID=259322 RepID=UPI0025EF9879|nr:T9SS C-terminal target domain-containing protein [uncultured Chryseobacterium sp.]